jgi:dTDP-4-dehydrorhamnose 3,5-epimerase
MSSDHVASSPAALAPATRRETGEAARPRSGPRLSGPRLDVRSAEIPAVKLITPVRHRDGRGFFAETYSQRALAEAGIEADFVQDNFSLSSRAGTLRGLHFQTPPHAQAKLVWVPRGAAIDVAVDLRHGSPTFGRHVMVELNAEDGVQILVPKGFAHGILTLMPDTMVAYKVDAYYAPGHDFGVRWDDPDLAIPWPLPREQIVLSEKDRAQPLLRELPPYFRFATAARRAKLGAIEDGTDCARGRGQGTGGKSGAAP